MSIDVFDPVQEAAAVGLFNGPVAAQGVMEVRAKGTEVGWYVRPDGAAVRLPVDMGTRDTMERKRFIFKRSWGIYSRHPVSTRYGEVQPESEWKQLARLAREHPNPDERAAIRAALGATFATSPHKHVNVLTCACGQEYTAQDSFDNHQYGCVPAIRAEEAAAGAAPPSDVKPPASDDAPVATFTCLTCGKAGFKTALGLSGHMGSHAKRK